MVYEKAVISHLVEAKTIRAPDHSQLAPNLYLALAKGATVVYAVKSGQGEAYREAYDRLTLTEAILHHREIRAVVSHQVIHIPQDPPPGLKLPPARSFADSYF